MPAHLLALPHASRQPTANRPTVGQSEWRVEWCVVDCLLPCSVCVDIEGLYDVIDTSQLKNGLTLIIDGMLSSIVEFQHVKPGKGGAFVRTKIRNLRTGNTIEKTFRSGEKFEEAYIEHSKLQYTYQVGDVYHFLNLDSFEETEIAGAVIGAQAGFLQEEMEVLVQRYQHDVIGIELPANADIVIAWTEPGLKGDSSKTGTKMAKLDTGATVMVPLFIETGEAIKVDTRTGKYISRA
jgi:elongation factor P